MACMAALKLEPDNEELATQKQLIAAKIEERKAEMSVTEILVKPSIPLDDAHGRDMLDECSKAPDQMEALLSDALETEAVRLGVKIIDRFMVQLKGKVSGASAAESFADDPKVECSDEWMSKLGSLMTFEQMVKQLAWPTATCIVHAKHRTCHHLYD